MLSCYVTDSKIILIYNHIHLFMDSPRPAIMELSLVNKLFFMMLSLYHAMIRVSWAMICTLTDGDSKICIYLYVYDQLHYHLGTAQNQSQNGHPDIHSILHLPKITCSWVGIYLGIYFVDTRQGMHNNHVRGCYCHYGGVYNICSLYNKVLF